MFLKSIILGKKTGSLSHVHVNDAIPHILHYVYKVQRMRPLLKNSLIFYSKSAPIRPNMHNTVHVLLYCVFSENSCHYEIGSFF